jgi:hypothetical protein
MIEALRKLFSPQKREVSPSEWDGKFGPRNEMDLSSLAGRFISKIPARENPSPKTFKIEGVDQALIPHLFISYNFRNSLSGTGNFFSRKSKTALL